MSLVLSALLWTVALVSLLVTTDAFRRSSMTKIWRRAGVAAAAIAFVFGIAMARVDTLLSTGLPIGLIGASFMLIVTMVRFGFRQSLQEDLERHLAKYPELERDFQRNWLLRRLTGKGKQ